MILNHIIFSFTSRWTMTFWCILVLSFPIAYLFCFPFLFFSILFFFLPSFFCSFLFLPFFFPSSLPSFSPTLSLQIMCFDTILWFSKLLLQRNSNYFKTFLGSLGFPAQSFSKGARIIWKLQDGERIGERRCAGPLSTSAYADLCWEDIAPSGPLSAPPQLVSILSIHNTQPFPCSTRWSGKFGNTIEVCLEISSQLHQTLLFLGHAWGTLWAVPDSRDLDRNTIKISPASEFTKFYGKIYPNTPYPLPLRNWASGEGGGHNSLY